MCLHPGGSPRGAGGLLLLMKKTSLGEGLPGSQHPPCSAAPGCSSGNRTWLQGEWPPDGEAGTWMGSPCPSGPHLLLWRRPLLLGAGWSRPGCGLTLGWPLPLPSPVHPPSRLPDASGSQQIPEKHVHPNLPISPGDRSPAQAGKLPLFRRGQWGARDDSEERMSEV